MQRLSKMLNELVAARNVLYQLVRQHLVLRYRRTILGYVWTLINPLLMMIVTAVVFANLFHMDLKTFAIFMFAGMVPWNCFSGMVTQSSSAFINNEGLIKKIYLPKIIFPLSVSLGVAIDSVLSLIALFALILFIGGNLTWALAFLPIAYFLLFFFSFGIALVISILTVYLRDIQHVIAIALQALFFLTPVLYEKKALTGVVSYLITLNPLTNYIDLFRMPIRYGMLPDMHTILLAGLLSFASMVVGLCVFLSHEKKIVFRL